MLTINVMLAGSPLSPRRFASPGWGGRITTLWATLCRLGLRRALERPQLVHAILAGSHDAAAQRPGPIPRTTAPAAR